MVQTNLVSSNRCIKSVTKVKNLQCSFLPGRIIPYWNKLPTEVKNCLTVLSFKTRLEGFKKDMISKCIINDFHFCLIMLTTVTPSDLWFPIAQQKDMEIAVSV